MKEKERGSLQNNNCLLNTLVSTFDVQVVRGILLCLTNHRNILQFYDTYTLTTPCVYLNARQYTL